MKLHISSGRHLSTDVEGRIREIEEELDSLDVAFTEYRVTDTPLREKILDWVAAPVTLFFILSWTILFTVVSAVSSSEDDIIERLNEKYSTVGYSVDQPVHDLIKENRRT